MQAGVRVPFRIVGIPDEYTVTGSQADIFRHYGISHGRARRRPLTVSLLVTCETRQATS